MNYRGGSFAVSIVVASDTGATWIATVRMNTAPPFVPLTTIHFGC